mgnify:CR=1 FL=1
MTKNPKRKEIKMDSWEVHLVGYLERHEQDIGLEINDFGELRGLFMAIFGREPRCAWDKTN